MGLRVRRSECFARGFRCPRPKNRQEQRSDSTTQSHTPFTHERQGSVYFYYYFSSSSSKSSGITTTNLCRDVPFSVSSRGVSMPCGKCGRWKYNEWLSWHRFDLDPPPADLAVTRDDEGTCWFFYCGKCKRSLPLSRGCYINTDGNVTTDSDNDTVDVHIGAHRR